jgi:hypothetical protein
LLLVTTFISGSPGLTIPPHCVAWLPTTSVLAVAIAPRGLMIAGPSFRVPA